MASTHTRGLLDPRLEHDSCGFGLIAQLDNQPSRWLVDTALSSLARMSHRGAILADGRTGDGCGLLLHRPDEFLRSVADEAGIRLGHGFCAGNIFLPQDTGNAQRARAVLAEELERVGIQVAGWRRVPINESACGPIGLACLPRIEQMFVCPQAATGQAGMQRMLFLARRRAEMRLADLEDFYVVSLSASTLGYKGLVLAPALADFFPDLAHPAMASGVALFHQRFSTNTAPRWPLAQPFRLLAHNGEINTIEGNRRWATARVAKWHTPALDLRELQPPISMHGSDSQSMDNMVELLLAGGMDLLCAMRILVPPATSVLEHTDPDLAAFYQYFGLNCDPWDGPAGIVLCDGRYAACTLDRNGLRPARWSLTRDRHLTVASETGVWDCPPQEIVAKGKLGPGEMLAVDLYSGELLDNTRIDAINRSRTVQALAEERPEICRAGSDRPFTGGRTDGPGHAEALPEAVHALARGARIGAARAGRNRAGSHRLDGR